MNTIKSWDDKKEEKRREELLAVFEQLNERGQETVLELAQTLVKLPHNTKLKLLDKPT